MVVKSNNLRKTIVSLLSLVFEILEILFEIVVKLLFRICDIILRHLVFYNLVILFWDIWFCLDLLMLFPDIGFCLSLMWLRWLVFLVGTWCRYQINWHNKSLCDWGTCCCTYYWTNGEQSWVFTFCLVFVF